MMKINRSEENNVIADILRWKIEEVEVGAGQNFSDEEVEEYVDMLVNMSDQEIYNHWMNTVGEWVLSRNDVQIPDDSDEWLNEQYEAISQGEETPWGYIVSFEPKSVEYWRDN